MKFVIPLAIALFATTFVAAQTAQPSRSESESALPKKSSELLTELQTWETEKRRQLDEQILRKRKLAIQALTQHLDEATKSGKAEAAAQIRQAIERLSKRGNQATIQEQLRANLSGSRWTTTDWDEATITLSNNGNVLFSTGKKGITWSIAGDGRLYFKDGTAKAQAAVFYGEDLKQFRITIGTRHTCVRIE